MSFRASALPGDSGVSLGLSFCLSGPRVSQGLIRVPGPGPQMAGMALEEGSP